MWVGAPPTRPPHWCLRRGAGASRWGPGGGAVHPVRLLAPPGTPRAPEAPVRGAACLLYTSDAADDM
eukprot:2752305-Alexandrium_andersonii.AAC.1